MKLLNLAKFALTFAAGVFAGAYYMHTRMREEYQNYADEQIESMRQHFAEKEAKMDAEIESQAVKKGIDFAMEKLNLQDSEGKSIYETDTRTYELIPPDEFGEIDEFDTSFLTYTADRVLCYDQTGEKVENVQRTVGPDALDNIGKFIPDTIHVRNHLYRKDYEILRSLETYDEFMSPREEDTE